MYKVYAIEITDDNAYYVGITSRDLKTRIDEHLQDDNELGRLMRKSGSIYGPLKTGIYSEYGAREVERQEILNGRYRSFFPNNDTLAKSDRLLKSRRCLNKQNNPFN